MGMSHLSEEQLDQLIAAERAREQEPLNAWRTIAARAREEGLLRETHRWSSSGNQSWLQAAAAVLLLVGGIAIGRSTLGLPTASSPVSAVAQDRSAATQVSPVNQMGSANNLPFASVEEASAALDKAVLQYQSASQYLAARNVGARASDSASMYSARAAALAEIMDATKNALQTAPHDPVINQYYLATMGARVATQQLAARPVVLKGF
jgi:hypothetical protein